MSIPHPERLPRWRDIKIRSILHYYNGPRTGIARRTSTGDSFWFEIDQEVGVGALYPLTPEEALREEEARALYRYISDTEDFAESQRRRMEYDASPCSEDQGYQGRFPVATFLMHPHIYDL